MNPSVYQEMQMTPRKPQPESKPYFAEIHVRIRYDAPDAPQARLLASKMSAQLREVTLAGVIHSTKVSSVRHIQRNLAEEQEQNNVTEFKQSPPAE